jgi:hypothetical protein
MSTEYVQPQLFALIIDTHKAEVKAAEILRADGIIVREDDVASNVLHVDASKAQRTEDLLTLSSIGFQWAEDSLDDPATDMDDEGNRV